MDAYRKTFVDRKARPLNIGIGGDVEGVALWIENASQGALAFDLLNCNHVSVQPLRIFG